MIFGNLSNYRDEILSSYNPLLSISKNAKIIIKERPHLPTTMQSLRKFLTITLQEIEDAKPKPLPDLDEVDVLEIPESFYEEKEIFEIKPYIKKMVILGDIHVPYHDAFALKAALQYAKEIKPDAIYLNGDILDMHSMSRFTTKPSERNLTLELDLGRQFFALLRNSFPEIPIFYKFGNHEDRFDHYLWNNARELDDVVSLQDLLKIKDHNITHVDSMTPAKFGKLYIIHGHEMRGGMFAPVNIARTIKLKTLVNTITNHFHQRQEFIQKDMAGGVSGCWSVGCLCGLKPRYMPINNWSHGFAVVTRSDDKGNFELENKAIINGRII